MFAADFHTYSKAFDTFKQTLSSDISPEKYDQVTQSKQKQITKRDFPKGKRLQVF